MKYDLVIIGAGPGGYVSAIRAAQLGLKVALIEKDEVGGTCLNRGCIPTKSFAASAKQSPANIAEIVSRKNKTVAGLRNGIHQLLKSNKIDLINGSANFVSKNELKITDNTGHESRATSDAVIIATGSEWKPLPGLKPDGKKILTSDQLLNIEKLPEKLLIIGGGVIGCEFASIMHAFGVEVTIIEVMEQILPSEDAFIARMLTSSFKKRGIKIETGKTLEPLDCARGRHGTLLVSVGRKPNTDGLGLEKIGVKTKNGYIITDRSMSTSVPDIYAIGDVALPANGGKPMLAHVASHEGIVAVSNIKVQNSRVMDYSAVPRPIFTAPEIGCVGATEKQLKESGVKYKTGRFPYAAIGKAVCDNKTEGALQVYIGEDDSILGAHCIGAHATDVCSEMVLAMQNRLTAKQVAETIHAHPTYSEIIVEAMHKTGTYFLLLCFSASLLLASCSACPRGEDDPARAASNTLTFSAEPAAKPPESKQNNIKVINIGPSKNDDKRSDYISSSQPIPSEAELEHDLTSRLKEKMQEAFEGRSVKPPDVDIYTSSASLDYFAKYYEDRGYKIQRTSIPASQIIAPVLEEKSELRDKISLGNYAGITINQIIVEGIDVSAADKYIDPETYEIVYKTFVTVTRTK